VHVVVAVPAWMIADGEYGDVAVGHTAEFGFALEPELVEARAAEPGLEQAGGPVPTSVASGAVLAGSPNTPGVVDAGAVKPILLGDAFQRAGEVVARGRLVVEPFLWATDGLLWPLVPDGVRLWSVDRIRRVGSVVEDLEATPSVGDVDHDAVYVLDLSRP
jgi:hypothetical protein